MSFRGTALNPSCDAPGCHARAENPGRDGKDYCGAHVSGREKLTLVYVAGPYSGTDRAAVEANIRRAELLGVEVAKLGAMPVIPHSNTANPHFEAVQPYQFWIEGTMELLRRSDAVILTEDWARSRGARGEHLEATRLGKPVFMQISELRDWLWKRGVDPRVGA